MLRDNQEDKGKEKDKKKEDKDKKEEPAGRQPSNILI